MRGPKAEPNPENATVVQTAMAAAPTRRSFLRFQAIRALLLGFTRAQVNGSLGQLYMLERRAGTNNPWLPQRPILLTGVTQTNQLPGLTANELWRLRRWHAYPPQLDAPPGTNGTIPLTIFGRPGIAFRVERSGNLSSNWQVISNATFAVPGGTLNLPAPGNGGFYRVVEP